MNARVLAGLVTMVAVFGATGATCTPTPTTDSNTPTVHVLAWNDDGKGGQASQSNYLPGGSFTVKSGFLGANKSDIRVYGEEKPGVKKLTVALTAFGTCSTKADGNGTVWTAPSNLSATGPTLTKDASNGNVESFLALNIDDALAGEPSCGMHIYNGMTKSQEFFLDYGVWTVNATAENCCGNKGTGTFKITVQ
jgi:hypothetical protein